MADPDAHERPGEGAGPMRHSWPGGLPSAGRWPAQHPHSPRAGGRKESLRPD